MKKILLICLIVGLSGCASYRPNALPAFFVGNDINTVKKNDVAISIKFFDCEESIKYFDCKTCERKIDVALITIVNQSNKIYGFQKRSIVPKSIGANDASNKCSRSIVFNGGIFPPALVRNNKINREIKEDFLQQEIKDAKVKQNEELRGIVFFNQINKGDKFIIPLFTIDTNEKILFEFIKS